ncbi:MAG: WYL domain-containing protein [Myxococcales bacterium]|nr:WYL domain-containing protein [Myxococcales bacterium]MCB9566698.1 WYL domain-containing protein [Myxococcales bacterium]MCB9704431.1 WYL domain-containing protein [Myxococcales bacterium]
MTDKNDSSRTVQQTARLILRYLRDNPEGTTKETLAKKAQVAPVTVQRALKFMREEWDAPLEFNHGSKRWHLLDAKFTLPLTDPDPEDLTAVVFASALLAPVGDEELNSRVKRLIEQMDDALEDAPKAKNDAKVRPRSVTATVTTGSQVDYRMVSKLLLAIGSGVVRIEYESPWAGTHKTYDIEPWQIRIHDGQMYMRAYSRSHGEPRSFRVAQVTHARVLPSEAPREAVPTKDELWGGQPAYGIDWDRPGTATFRVRGGVARWIGRMIWDPGQEDRWIEPGDLLERKMPYHSCRELARRLLSIADGLEMIEPKELRDEVLGFSRGLIDRVGGGAAS